MISWCKSESLSLCPRMSTKFCFYFFLHVRAVQPHMNMPLQNFSVAPCIASLNSNACGPIESYYLTGWDIGCLSWFLTCDLVSNFHSCLSSIGRMISPAYCCWFHTAQIHVLRKGLLSWVIFKYLFILSSKTFPFPGQDLYTKWLFRATDPFPLPLSNYPFKMDLLSITL